MTSVTASEDDGRLRDLDGVWGRMLMAEVLFHTCPPFLLGPQLWIVDGEMGGGDDF